MTASRSETDALPGYSIREHVATGGMAEVLIAEPDARPGDSVVVKRLLPHLANGEAVALLFAHEIRVLRGLAHAAVPKVLDEGADARGAPFVVLERIHGVPLSRAIERGAQPGLAAWCSLATQLLDALAHVHARTGADGKPLDIVHRDVNPSNVLITDAGALKLIDFGIASSAARKPEQADADRGTPGYVSPEVLTGATLGDARSDVFGAGVVLFEAAIAARLFEGNRFAVMNMIAEGEIPALSSRRADFTAFDPVLARALARKPGDRFVTALAMRDEVQATADRSRVSPDRDALGALARSLAG